MKVRLKPEKAKLDKLVAEFQFHEGPIKTKYKDKKEQQDFVSIP